MKTTVILNTGDFSHMQVQENLHIVISVKDFKAIVTHAQALDAVLNAFYSDAGRPLQFMYKKGSVLCQYTLMTAGENRALPAMSGSSSNRKASSNESISIPQPKSQFTSMPPPPRPRERRNLRSLGRRGTASDATSAVSNGKESDNLFVTQDDDEDRAWDPPNYDTGEETLGWDASGVGVC
jgi:cell cycle checkpoint control protein RAD9A